MPQCDFCFKETDDARLCDICGLYVCGRCKTSRDHIDYDKQATKIRSLGI